MSDADESLSPLEILKSQHTKQKKELQGKITALKHSVNKNDKKRKKEVQTMADNLEKELKDKQEKELANFNLEHKMSESATILGNNEQAPKLTDSSNNENVVEERKPTRAQLRRNKKAEEVKRKVAAALEDERNAEFSQGKIEADQMRKALRDRNLRIHEIAPDGDCLYNALSYQIDKGRKFSGAQLRKIAAKFIRNNCDDFLPFLMNDNGDVLDDFGFEEYCGKVERTSQEGGIWGGEAELRAISAALCRPIEVVQPDGISIHFGESFSPPPIIVAYQRFAYTLGEHYNSTVQLPVGSTINEENKNFTDED